MKVRERVIRESITRIEKRIAEMDALHNRNFVSEIIALRQEWAPKLSTLSREKLQELCETEASLFALADKQSKTCLSYIGEKVELESEKREMETELYTMS